VYAVWEVDCIDWYGHKHTGYTTDEDFANNVCKHCFGWHVRKMEGWTYKYSKSFGETKDTRGLMQWVQPDNPDAACWSVSRHELLSEDTRTKEKWDKCVFTKGF
jgi:hypothetical protein